MVSTLLQIAAGGALGAVLRYGVGVATARAIGSGFPVATLGVNIVGSLAMGAFVGIAASRGLTPVAPFVMIGLLGGFTTFSAFSLDTIALIERGEIFPAALYVALSVILSVAALWLGLLVTRGAA